MDTIEELKKAITKAGFEVMPQEDFEEWWASMQLYQDSPEGRAESIAEDALLKYYLDNIAKYKFTDEMGEISGFGDGYEMACRVMLDAGLQWLDNNPDANPKYKGMKDVYGILSGDNEDAKSLSDAVTATVDGCSGAMHQAVITSCLWISKYGWDEYVIVMSKKKE